MSAMLCIVGRSTSGRWAIVSQVGTEAQRWARDLDARAVRYELVEQLTAGLLRTGQYLRLVGNVVGDGRVTGASPRGNGDDRLVAVGYLAEAASSLLRSTRMLVDDGHTYAAGALVRQLVEVEYLAWAFASENGDAAVWLNSSTKERLATWQPRHLRQRADGVFDRIDYSTHCELGGHPTPDGLQALVGSTSEAPGQVILADSLSHVLGVWTSVLAFEDSSAVAPDLASIVDRWRERDHLLSIVRPVR